MGKSRFAVHMEKNTTISNNIRINFVLCSSNCKPAFARPCTEANLTVGKTLKGRRETSRTAVGKESANGGLKNYCTLIFCPPTCLKPERSSFGECTHCSNRVAPTLHSVKTSA